MFAANHAPDGTPPSRDVWARYRTEGALDREALHTNRERLELKELEVQVRPLRFVPSCCLCARRFPVVIVVVGVIISSRCRFVVVVVVRDWRDA